MTAPTPALKLDDYSAELTNYFNPPATFRLRQIVRDCEALHKGAVAAEVEQDKVFSVLGMAYTRLRDRERAEWALKAAIHHGRNNPVHWANYAALLIDVGRFEEGQEWSRKALTLFDKPDPLVLLNLAEAQAGLGESDVARATLRDAMPLVRATKDAQLFLLAASQLAICEEDNQAVQIAAEAFAMDLEQELGHSTAGEFLRKIPAAKKDSLPFPKLVTAIQRATDYTFHFKADRAAQACAVLLGNEKGAHRGTEDLLGLLYMADRQALLATGTPITGAEWVRTSRGPSVKLSAHSFPEPCHLRWTSSEVTLAALPGDDQLSAYFVEVLEALREKWSESLEDLQALPESKFAVAEDGELLSPIFVLEAAEVPPATIDHILTEAAYFARVDEALS